MTSQLEALAHAVVMASFEGPRPPDWLLRRIGAGLGSVCLFGSNLTQDDDHQDDDHVRELTDRLHAVGPAVLVAVDEEAGDVTRLDARRGSPWPGAAATGAAGSPDLTRELHHELGARLAACGIDLDLAPVADVNSDPANPVIGVRSFGARSDEVAAHVAAAVQGLRHGGVAACVKHFPGHGDTRTDSHRALAVLDVPADVLAARDLPPFRAAVDAGVEAVMTGHLIVPSLDPAGPASTSRHATALLREGLGFRGVVVTDALDMEGISGAQVHGSLPAAAVAALTAGADLLCLGADKDDADVGAVVDAIVAAVLEGELPRARLEEAGGRVAALGAGAAARRSTAAARSLPGPAGAAGAAGGTAPSAPAGAGRRAAAAAIGVTGRVPDLTGAVVLRLVTEPGVAVGTVPWGMGPALARLLPGVVCRDVRPDTAVDLPAPAAGRPVVAVVRDAHRHPWVLERLAGLAAARPDLVTVEMGWRAPVRLPGGTVVHTLGASAVSAEVAAEALAGGRSAGLAVHGLAARNGTSGLVRPRDLHAGLDIGGSKVLAVAVDAAGHVLGEVRAGTTHGPDGVVESAATAVTALAGRLGVAVGDFASVGIGVPGLVDARTGTVRHAVNLGVGADALALAERLEHRFGVPLTVENDVNAAAVGAAARLDLRGVDLAYLSIGTGLAAGLVLRGDLHRGARSAAGEIGHVPVDPSGPLCACGQRGCLEVLASGSAIAAAWPRGSSSGAEGAGAPRARDLFAAAAGGDPRATAVRADVARHLASAVRLLVLTVDVDVVVLGGGVAEVGEPLRAAVATALADHGERSPFLRALDLPSRVRIVPAGPPVAAVGAALLGRRALA